jgi:AcrR family transcriptional regulator
MDIYVKENVAPGLAKRLENSRLRRNYILVCAAHLIDENGIENLTLAKLAKKANVTVPTIQNLIGKKAEVLDVLVIETMQKVVAVANEINASSAIDFILALGDKLVGLIETDEALYKAAFMAGERSGFFEHKSESGIYQRSLKIAQHICEQCIAAGERQGQLDSLQLAKSLFAVQRLARQDWMNGYTNLAEYKLQLKSGMLLVLCADATPDYKVKLISKINELSL